MTKRTNEQPVPTQTPLEQIQDESNVVHVLTTQLEALARVLTQVRTVEDPDQDPPITPDEFVSIMQVFHEKLYALKDISGSLDGAIDDEPTPLAAV